MSAAQPGGDGEKLSRTRDQLANERTYLAWLRTAANVMILGLAVAKFIGQSGPRDLAAGTLLVAVGAAGLFYGTARYRRVSAQIDQGTFVSGVGVRGPTIATVVLVAAVAVALALVTIG